MYGDIYNHFLLNHLTYLELARYYGYTYLALGGATLISLALFYCPGRLFQTREINIYDSTFHVYLRESRKKMEKRRKDEIRNK